ncbi:MAG: M3 family oligoendopeptidase [Planctomycetaceae bacterium]|nr:M3 family oligoendopeptidase [Planctomycetaceae bacterium]
MSFPLTWQLTELGPIPGTSEFSAWKNRIETLSRDLQQQLRTALPNAAELSAAQLKKQVDAYGTCRAEYWQAKSLVACWAAADAANAAYRQAEAEVALLTGAIEVTDHLLNSVIASISDEQWETITQAAEVAEVVGFLTRRRQEAESRLPDHLVELASELGVDGMHAWARLYDTFSGTLRIPLMEQGEIVHKSPGQVMFDSPDRSERKNNFYAARKAWQQVDDLAAATLNHLIGSRLTLQKYSGHPSYLHTPCQQNRVTVKAIEAMWEAIEETKPLVRNYLSAKQKLLGIEELGWFDVDAPLNLTSARVPYQEGCQIILNSFAAFDPDLEQFAQLALKEGWVEAENRSGKRQGGFCIDFPLSGQTRIFMTYRETEEALGTLAHELGHAYHGWVLRNHPHVMQMYPMSLAETASTFAETIVAEHRNSLINNREDKLAALDRQLSDAVAYLMNIHCRYLFDKAIHERRAQGELRIEEYYEYMHTAQKHAYGNIFADDAWGETFWISKLHFYLSDEPFYNFPYTMGHLLSQYVYEVGRNEPSGFAQHYAQFLIATGGPSAIAAVKDAFGGDMETVEFWSQALEPIRRRAKEFCQLASE